MDYNARSKGLRKFYKTKEFHGGRLLKREKETWFASKSSNVKHFSIFYF